METFEPQRKRKNEEYNHSRRTSLRSTSSSLATLLSPAFVFVFLSLWSCSSIGSTSTCSKKPSLLLGVTAFACSRTVLSGNGISVLHKDLQSTKKSFVVEPSSSVRKRSKDSSTKRLQQSYNPFGSMLGDVASSFKSKMTGGGGDLATLSPTQEEEISKCASKTWEELRQLWESKTATIEEREFRTNLPYGYGKASPLHNLRLYSSQNKEDDVRIIFYRDSASWCPYCQKVWIALETKRIPYKIERVNMRCYGNKKPEFLRMQPSGQIPVAIIDGQVYGQSNDILFVLDEAFPNSDGGTISQFTNPQRAQQLLQLGRQLFSVWMQWLTGSSRGKGQFVRVLNMVEQVLSEVNDGPGFFMGGNNISLVDIQFAPFLERMAASLLYYKGFQIRVPSGISTEYPYINRWFDAMESKEAYLVTKSDHYTHCWDLPPQLGGCTFESNGEPFQKRIDGKTPGSWSLPLEEHNGGIEPDWYTFLHQTEDDAKREAVERLTWNFSNIVKFACRGASPKGMPPVMAPLSDPNATSEPIVINSVDTALRIVTLALLSNNLQDVESDMSKLVKAIPPSNSKAVVSCLEYLKDRIGVPRDMRYPAARQLRAHLNWAIDMF